MRSIIYLQKQLSCFKFVVGLMRVVFLGLLAEARTFFDRIADANPEHGAFCVKVRGYFVSR